MSERRRAARIVLLCDDTVLLLKGFDPGDPGAGPWWITPGGGMIGDESPESAAARELYEETGHAVAPERLGPVVATRVAHFSFEGRDYEQAETFFAVRAERFEPHGHGWEEAEQRSLMEHRWWRVDDLAATDERVYPVELPVLVRALLDDTLTRPLHLGGESGHTAR